MFSKHHKNISKIVKGFVLKFSGLIPIVKTCDMTELNLPTLPCLIVEGQRWNYMGSECFT